MQHTSSFPATLWTQMLELRDASDTPRRQELLALFYSAYFYPLYAYVRRSGHSQHDAEDLTQSFFAKYILDPINGLVTRMDPTLGRLRNLLLTAMQHFIIAEWRKAQALKRGGGQPSISFDAMEAEERYLREPVDTTTPEELYHRQVARDFLANVSRLLSDDFAARNKRLEHKALMPYLLQEGTAAIYDQAAQGLGVTGGNFRVMVHRLRKKYRDLFRAEVAKTLDSPTDEAVADEVRELVRLASGG